MYYQLPNGKVINLDISDILSLTDADIQYLISMNAGESITNPFHGSVIRSSTKKTYDELDEDDDIDDVDRHTQYHEEYFGNDIIDENGFDPTDLDIEPE